MCFKEFAEQDDQIQVSSQRFPIIARLLFSTFSIDDTIVKRNNGSIFLKWLNKLHSNLKARNIILGHR